LTKLIPSKKLETKKLSELDSEHSRISALIDREDKVRLIAVGDYFSQTVLKPFHNFLYSFLRTIPQDRTFSQTVNMPTEYNEKCIFHSADLSSATDRFPLDLICLVLEGRFPKYYVDL